MSYILDALKKAEAERHIGQVPGLHVQPARALPRSPAATRGKQMLLAAGAVLLAAGGTLTWLQPWQAPLPASRSPTVEPSAAAPRTTTAPPSFEATAPPTPAPQIIAAAPPPVSPRPADRPAVKPRNTPAASAAGASKPATTSGTGKPPAAQAVPAQASATDADLKLSAALTPEAGMSSPRELPEQIQHELPSLAIGGYIYSDNPRERQLLVNRRLLHEGEEAAPGVTLEKMLPKAAVFNYKGYRYRLAY